MVLRSRIAGRRFPIGGMHSFHSGGEYRCGVSMLPERSTIVNGLTLRPVETLNLSRTIAFQSISGSGTAAALRQLRMLVERYASS